MVAIIIIMIIIIPWSSLIALSLTASESAISLPVMSTLIPLFFQFAINAIITQKLIMGIPISTYFISLQPTLIE